MPLRDRNGKSSDEYRDSSISALDSISPRLRPKRRNPALWGWLLVPVAALWLNWAQLTAHFGQVPASPALPAPPTGPPTQSASVTSIAAGPPQVHLHPQPLSDCMAGGTVINEQVLRCRFGEVPRPRPHTEPSHGMVSAAYLAKYEAERGTRPVSGDGNRRTGSESHWITGWDGSGNYLATWQIVDNDVDDSSVCLNYRRGSIEYRECRKGAKQWFKNQCRGGDNGEVTRQRYCSAASSFSPID